MSDACPASARRGRTGSTENRKTVGRLPQMNERTGNSGRGALISLSDDSSAFAL